MRVDHERKSDGVKVDHAKKSDGVRVHHQRKSDGVRVHQEKKSDRVRVHHERKNHHTDAYAQEGDITYQRTEVFFMVVKDVDSVMTCGAVLAQMLKGEKHFANTVPCNTGLSNQSHCSHFQIKTGHFCHLNF